MHIRLETDYAIRIVDTLARQKGKSTPGTKSSRLDAKTISENTGVPLRFALKILRRLVGAQVVKSYKGIYGGYEIVKPLSEISLGEIIELFEGEYKLSRCLGEGYTCDCASPCSYQAVFDRITKQVISSLKNETFDNLIK